MFSIDWDFLERLKISILHPNRTRDLCLIKTKVVHTGDKFFIVITDHQLIYMYFQNYIEYFSYHDHCTSGAFATVLFMDKILMQVSMLNFTARIRWTSCYIITNKTPNTSSKIQLRLSSVRTGMLLWNNPEMSLFDWYLY